MTWIDLTGIDDGFPWNGGTIWHSGNELDSLSRNLPVQAAIVDDNSTRSQQISSHNWDGEILPDRQENQARSPWTVYHPHLGPLSYQGRGEQEEQDITGSPLTIPTRITRKAGIADNQAGGIIQADFTRPLFASDGRGVTIGVISDSYNFLGGAAADIASGDLPPNVVVLKEGTPFFGENPVDEGRAMMQLIHDIAPGARLLFHTVGDSERDLATAIRALANAGADIIVDDIGFIDQPYFQDGFAAQAVDEVAARGVAYFAAAGNDGRNAYQSGFDDSGIVFNFNQLPLSFGARNTIDDFLGGRAHDFDPSPTIDIFQRFTLGPGEIMVLSLQWDQPFASISPGKGAQNDIDIYVLNAAQNTVLGGSNLNNVGNDPRELLFFSNNSLTTNDYNLMILRREGAAPGLMRYVQLEDIATIREFATNSPTIYGHPNAAFAFAAGAVDYRTPNLLQPFSSAGPTPILFDPQGNRLPVPDLRLRPRIVAPDTTNTTFFNSGFDPDGDGFPNFRGSSASAPTAAAVAALMLQVAPEVSPRELYLALERTATDLGASGFDFDSGFGLISSDRAVSILNVFNPNFYLTRNPDIAQAVSRGVVGSGLEHFLLFGQFENRDPGPGFSNAQYLAENPDVAALVANGTIKNGFQNFLYIGQLEGRDKRTLFDREYYQAQNPDIVQAVANGIVRSTFDHFIKFGQIERRNPNPFFDANFYLTQNPEIAQAVNQGIVRSAYDHFVRFGQVEGRDPSLLFNTRVYLSRNPDVALAVNRGIVRSAFEHFFLFGRNEGRLYQ
jgi:subtilisin family serine protease